MAVIYGGAAHAEQAQRLPSQPMQILRDGEIIATLDVEVARSYEEKQQGLMFRTHLPEEAGMLFIYTPPQEVKMWMKNTLIPLDMLFFTEDKRIAHIHRNAKPHALDTISGGMHIWAVMELNGGAAEKLGIAVGDRLHIPQPAAEKEG